MSSTGPALSVSEEGDARACVAAAAGRLGIPLSEAEHVEVAVQFERIRAFFRLAREADAGTAGEDVPEFMP